jgi:IclR family pca regulon transcriptional regulator
MREGDFVNGLAKGLSVIAAFDAGREKLAIADVARLTDLDRATARRCLLTLAELGYAHYDGKFFTLTQKILRLGHSYLTATPLPRLVQPVLERLSEATGESASVSVLEGTEIIYVARASQKRVMSINLNPGSRLPAYCSSMGRVLLAALPKGEAETVLRASALVANTGFTKTDPVALLAELDRVKAQGYAVIDQELEVGLRSIAVPLFNASGKVVAALNFGAQAARVSVEEMEQRLLPLMRAAQEELRGVLF